MDGPYFLFLTNFIIITGTETSIVIFGKRATVVGRLVVILSFSEVRLNAAVALKNLLSLVNEDGELTRGSETPESAASSIEKLVNSGKSVLQSNLGHSITIAYPEVDAFVAFVDNITQVSNLYTPDTKPR